MNFKKTTKQREAIPLLVSKKFAALYGGSRSGKTFILIYSLIVRAAKTKSRHAIVRRTFSSVKRSVWMDTLPKVMTICFPNVPIRYNKTDYYATLPNGSEIWLCGLDDSRVEKILGMEFSTIYFNEASELDYINIQTVISRLAEKNSLVKKVWFDFNPPAKSHWSYWLFIKLQDPIEAEPLDSPDDYGCMMMNPIDNLENIDEEYLNILKKMPEKDRQRFLEGQFSDSNDGSVYYAFNRNEHVQETLKDNGTIFIGLDFNVQPMTGVVGQYINGTFYIQDEMFLENSDTYKACDWLKRKGYMGTVIPDSTGKNRKTSGKSDHQILKEAGFFIPPVKNPFVLDRVNNINRLFTDNRIIINPRCKKLIGDLEKVGWKDSKIDPGPEKMLGHITDALGYLCWKIDPIKSSADSSIRIS